MPRVETLKPPVGTKLTCFFGANKYRGEVVRYGRAFPVVRFKLRNGKVKEGRATILPPGAALGVTYSGYLAQLFATDPSGNGVPTPPVQYARTDVLLCVCAGTWKPAAGESLAQLAERLGGGYYPHSTTRGGENFICAECASEDTE